MREYRSKPEKDTGKRNAIKHAVFVVGCVLAFAGSGTTVALATGVVPEDFNVFEVVADALNGVLPGGEETIDDTADNVSEDITTDENKTPVLTSKTTDRGAAVYDKGSAGESADVNEVDTNDKFSFVDVGERYEVPGVKKDAMIVEPMDASADAYPLGNGGQCALVVYVHYKNVGNVEADWRAFDRLIINGVTGKREITDKDSVLPKHTCEVAYKFLFDAKDLESGDYEVTFDKSSAKVNLSTLEGRWDVEYMGNKKAFAKKIAEISAMSLEQARTGLSEGAIDGQYTLNYADGGVFSILDFKYKVEGGKYRIKGSIQNNLGTETAQKITIPVMFFDAEGKPLYVEKSGKQVAFYVTIQSDDKLASGEIFEFDEEGTLPKSLKDATISELSISDVRGF